jgi:hypothetical protein
MLKSLDGVRQACAMSKAQMQIPSSSILDGKQGAKPSDCIIPRVNINRIEYLQMQNMNRDFISNQEEFERDRQIQFPMVSEDILKQEMEGEDPDNNNQQE